jgi:predicted nucleotidyltransferase
VKLAFDEETVGGSFRAHGVARLEAFGSLLRDDLRPDSDVDLPATLRPDAESRSGLLE